MSDAAKGLAGVVVGETKVSKVFGEEGRLIYRGYDIDDLASHATFEETVHLLWHERLPDRKELEAFRHVLGSRRVVPDAVASLLRGPLKGAEPMAALRTAVSAMAVAGPAPSPTREGALAAGLALLPVMPVMVAMQARAAAGAGPVAPDPSLDHAGMFLHALTGKAPSESARRAMDMALVLHADHGFNASTFSARVTASTLADPFSAITSAVGTLQGGLHGGANTNVMRMLESIGSVDRAVPHVKGMLERKEKVPGFGHRVYKVMDPRAKHLAKWSERLGAESGDTRWFEMTARIQDFVMAEKGLYPNVDLYSASLYRAMGIQKELYTTIFAISRVAGWIAHAAEQYADNKLIRPKSEYVGPKGLAWVPIERR